MKMEDLFAKMAQDSAIATVAIFALWRLSLVTIKLAQALVDVSTKNADTLHDTVDNNRP